MGRKPGATVRRVPSQKRSLEKYQAILRACAAVLRDQGYEGATTAKIAAEAGVGRGTLYQYFPNRETLVATLAEAELDRLLTHTIDARQARTAAPRTAGAARASPRGGPAGRCGCSWASSPPPS